jgi:GntR family transcriptional repressor for pyruvate dehydrogenase complex
MLKEVKKKRAYEDIVTQIRDLIEKGKLKPGDQLPIEKELTETFKVSRSTVREAMLSLETMNLVERRQGNGTYVLASSEDVPLKTLASSPLLASLFHEHDDVIDVLILRKIIEPQIAALASKNATPKQIDLLTEIIAEQEQDLAEGRNPVKGDCDFHYALARMSRNVVLERLLVALVRPLRRVREEYLQTKERKLKSLEGHRKIVAAIARGSATVARRAMLRHLEGIEKCIVEKGGGR